MEFDLELAKRESSENPVYYVQYGHARIAGILSNARQQGIDWSEGDLTLLTDPNELTLIRKMIMLPELVESMARSYEPHHLPHYALELATAFHWFYENCRVLSSDPCRLSPHPRPAQAGGKPCRSFCPAALYLMGMEAPQKM